MKPFNVTLVHPAAYEHALALQEAADYLHATLIACGHQAVRSTNQLMTKAYNIVLCAHLLGPSQMSKLPPDSIIFNSEQLEDPNGWHVREAAYREALERFCVWDYSHANLARIAHDNKSHIPFLNCAALRRTDMPRAPGRTLLFYGSATSHRARIVEALQARGVPVESVFGEYGTQRDSRILRAWAVLNLHKSDDTAAFEPIRVFYPLIQGVPVISEHATDASTEAFRQSVHFFESAALVDGVASLYQDPQTFAERSAAMLQTFRQTSPLAAAAAAAQAFLGRWS